MNSLIRDINEIRESIDLGIGDIFAFAKKNGYTAKRQRMYLRKQTIPVITFTKTDRIGGLGIVTQYVVNPDTQSWLLQACAEGQSAEDMVEFKKGESFVGLQKHMLRKNKITANQAASYLSPPVGVDLRKEIKNE